MNVKYVSQYNIINYSVSANQFTKFESNLKMSGLICFQN